MSFLALLSFTLFLLIGCNEKKEDCPFKPIEWDEKTLTVKTKDSKAFNTSLSLSGEISKALKKLGKGSINAEIGTKLDKLGEEEASSSIKYDERYVQNYNLCVNEICGLIGLIERSSTSLESKTKYENQLVDAVSKFHERVMDKVDKAGEKPILETGSKPAKNKDAIKNTNISTLEQTELEICIQLPYDSGGFSSISVDDKSANILVSSTKLNPRITVKSNPQKNQRIVIIGKNNDTCYLDRVFDIRQKDNFPIRFIPICK